MMGDPLRDQLAVPADFLFPGEGDQPVLDDLRNLAQIAAAWKRVSEDRDVAHTFARLESLAMLAVAKLGRHALTQLEGT